jgi:mono/diheme cytochrome c family protein
MPGNILTLSILVALVVLFAWLVRRAWRLKRWYLRWPALLLSGLLTLLLLLITVLDARGFYQLYASYPVPQAHVSIAGTPEQVARGEHMAAVMCATCHSTNSQLPLSGGFNLSDDAGLPLGDLVAPNITSGGVIKDLTDDEIWRILRTGVASNGRLTMMAGVPASRLSDEDAQAVLAYLRKSPAVQKQTPPINPSTLLLVFAGAGLVQVSAPAAIESISAPPKASSREYGEYIVGLLDCRGCHGPALDGNAPPPSPPGAANLTVVVPQWTKEQFFQAMRTGMDSTGHQIRPPMPWKTIGTLDDTELAALYEYLHALTPLVKK